MPKFTRSMWRMIRYGQLKRGSMGLKIIGAGFGRTGTWSTFVALNQLGFPSYHMQEVIINKANKSHLDFWRKVANSPPTLMPRSF